MSILDPLPTWIARHRKIMIQDLTDYVNIESPSDDKALLDQTLSFIHTWLHQRLGTPSTQHTVHHPTAGDTTVLDYPGDTGTPWISALCHYDTHWPAGTIKQRPISINDDRFTAPGALDTKSGLVHLVWALKAATATGLPRPNLRLILTGDHHQPAPHSQPIIKQETTRGTLALVCNPSQHGNLITTRKGIGTFHLTLRGRQAHPALNPNTGINAITELARILLDLTTITDPDAGTTITIGRIHGGTHPHLTAAQATADIDIRVPTTDEATWINQVLTDLHPPHPQATLTVTGGWTHPVMPRTDGTAYLYTQALAVARELGMSLGESSSAGASAGNFAADAGVPVLDGLGAVGGGAHTTSEWVSIEAMLERTCLTAGLLAVVSSPVRDAARPGL